MCFYKQVKKAVVGAFYKEKAGDTKRLVILGDRGIYSVFLLSQKTRQNTPRIVKNGRKLPSLHAICCDFKSQNQSKLAKMAQNV